MLHAEADRCQHCKQYIRISMQLLTLPRQLSLIDRRPHEVETGEVTAPLRRVETSAGSDCTRATSPGLRSRSGLFPRFCGERTFQRSRRTTPIYSAVLCRLPVFLRRFLLRSDLCVWGMFSSPVSVRACACVREEVRAYLFICLRMCERPGETNHRL